MHSDTPQIAFAAAGSVPMLVRKSDPCAMVISVRRCLLPTPYLRLDAEMALHSNPTICKCVPETICAVFMVNVHRKGTCTEERNVQDINCGLVDLRRLEVADDCGCGGSRFCCTLKNTRQQGEKVKSVLRKACRTCLASMLGGGESKSGIWLLSQHLSIAI